MTKEEQDAAIESLLVSAGLNIQSIRYHLSCYANKDDTRDALVLAMKHLIGGKWDPNAHIQAQELANDFPSNRWACYEAAVTRSEILKEVYPEIPLYFEVMHATVFPEEYWIRWTLGGGLDIDVQYYQVLEPS